ncbi:hypothetical protein C9374_006791 [Naegleria lovaniensis]|uniref:Uncharacterized protein n=1 Tax=Naegleria lovaniensis TaxID=51637 RepID=A0AA88GYE3_NAELO|nr:uncharacterized protein C9374_006791 [Naegleria lovaniensis]KAG2393260.1 hypothetical protein C9374_006791 [Naegleria lovaniensis]
MSQSEITSVIQSERFEHKICGMTSVLVQLLRSNASATTSSAQQQDAFFQPLISKLNHLLQSHFGNDTTMNVGFAFGNVAKTLYAHNVNLNENDVCVCLIMDSQLDIDCKMVTAVRKNSSLVSSNEKSMIWRLLYKYSFQ